MKKKLLFALMAVSLPLCGLPNDVTMPVTDAALTASVRNSVEANRPSSRKRHDLPSSPCPPGPMGPQGQAGATGSTGPNGPNGAFSSQFGYFYTKSSQLVTGTLGAPAAINFDTSGPHTSGVELVTDITFIKGSSAIALTQPGTYRVTYGSNSVFFIGTPSIDLALNGTPNGSTQFAPFYTWNTALISVDASDLAQGQNGAALLEVVTIGPGSLAISNFELGLNDVFASISVVLVNNAPSEP